MSHQSTELLPCPFCGGNAELKYSQGSEVWPQKWWCECLNCKLSYGGKFGSNFYERKSTGTKNQDDKARDAAISLWNHRILLYAPAEMQIHDERAEFEKWYHEDHGSSDYRCRSSGAYCNWEVQVAWQTWQARAELAIASVKREPLSDAKIIEICESEGLGKCLGLAVARAIEQAHGIG